MSVCQVAISLLLGGRCLLPRTSENNPSETVRKASETPLARHQGPPRAPFSARLAHLMRPGPAFEAAFGPLFGQSLCTHFGE